MKISDGVQWVSDRSSSQVEIDFINVFFLSQAAIWRPKNPGLLGSAGASSIRVHQDIGDLEDYSTLF